MPATNPQAMLSTGDLPPQLKPLLNSSRITMSLVESSYALQTSCETSSNMDMKFTALHKQNLCATLAALGQLEDTPAIQCYRLTSMSPPPRS
jgi:hypothetical protein